MVSEAEIDHVLSLIREGRTMEPVPRCGLVLIECYHRELLTEFWRSVPVLTPAAEARLSLRAGKDPI